MNQTAEITVTTATLDVAGARIYYEMRGTGPAVLLLGSPMDADSFAPFAHQLAGDHTVVTVISAVWFMVGLSLRQVLDCPVLL